jgi:hypothetical protein
MTFFLTEHIHVRRVSAPRILAFLLQLLTTDQFDHPVDEMVANEVQRHMKVTGQCILRSRLFVARLAAVKRPHT